MQALVFDGQLRVDPAYPDPQARPGWARVRVRTAGICRTDLEIVRGYMAFKGVLGHEFVGHVDQCSEPALLGTRVAGEINAGCGACDWCRRRLSRHCPHRTVLGILNHDGCLAEYCLLPIACLIPVPPPVTDDRAAMIEPLAAACEILEQVPVNGTERVVVLGDGRFGILCAWVLSTVAPDVTLVGHHPENLSRAAWGQVKTALRPHPRWPPADLVVEATGSGRGIVQAMSLCRPRGTIVLKSTVTGQEPLNLSALVIHEQTVVGSRCGQFRDAIRLLSARPDLPLERLIAARYPLAEALAAFRHATQRGTLKVLLDCG